MRGLEGVRWHSLYEADIAGILEADLPWEKLADKSVLIAGATGMIGTVLVDALLRKGKESGLCIRVTAMGRSAEQAKARLGRWWGENMFRYLQGDVCEPLQEKERFDYLIQAASNTHPLAYSSDPVGTMTGNFLGAYQMLRHAAKTKAERFLFVSSVEVYGENRGDVEKFDESYCGYIDCNTLRAGYPESKRAAEALCQAFAAQYGLDTVAVRLPRVYGPTMRPSDSKASSQFIQKAVNGEDIVLKSAGEQRYSYCYAADAAAALLTVLLKGQAGEVYNAADEQSDITLKDMAVYLAELTGRKVVFELPAAREAAGYSKADKALLDAEKLKALGWRAQMGIREGLKRTFCILRQRRKAGDRYEGDFTGGGQRNAHFSDGTGGAEVDVAN